MEELLPGRAADRDDGGAFSEIGGQRLPPPGCCPNGPHLRKWLDEAVKLVLDIRDPFSNPRHGQETVQIGVREIGWGLQSPRKGGIEEVGPAVGGCPNTVGPAVAAGDRQASHNDGLLEILSRVVHSRYYVGES